MTKFEIPLIVVVIGFPSSRQATNALKSGELFSSLRSSKLGWMECVRQNRWIQIAHHFPQKQFSQIFVAPVTGVGVVGISKAIAGLHLPADYQQFPADCLTHFVFSTNKNILCN